MPRTPDTYTANEAAQILGVTERRVRQLVSVGKLPGERGSDGTVRIPQQAVTEERKRRKRGTGTTSRRPLVAKAGSARTAGRAAAEPMDVDSLAQAVASAVGQRLEGQIELTRRAESLVRQELDEERAKRMQVERQLEQAQARLAELQARKRGLFRRS